MQRNSKRQSIATDQKGVRINHRLIRTPFQCSLTVGIIGIGVAHHHVAEDSAVVNGDADAEGIAIRVDHRRLVITKFRQIYKLVLH